MTYRAAAWLTLIIPFVTLFWSTVAAALGIAVDASLTLAFLSAAVVLFGIAFVWREM